MKKSAIFLLTLATAALTSAAGVEAQKLAIGERAPDISVTEWLTAKAPADKPRLIDFYHSASKEAEAMLGELNRYAERYEGRLVVVVVAREPKEKVQAVLLKDAPKYFAAIDGDGKTFAAFGVKVVPSGVLVDAKGKVLWSGNPTQLDSATLDRLLK